MINKRQWMAMVLPGWTQKAVLAALVGIGVAVFTGCGNSETREQVDATVEELTGKKSLERMEQMKDELSAIQQQSAQRLDQIDEINKDQ